MLCQLSYVRARRNVTEAAQTGDTISGTLEAPAKATRPPLLASLRLAPDSGSGARPLLGVGRFRLLRRRLDAECLGDLGRSFLLALELATLPELAVARHLLERGLALLRRHPNPPGSVRLEPR